MAWSKLKNIILLILLLVNGFLLFQVVGQQQQSARYAQEARTGALAVLQEAGIEMSAQLLPREVVLSPLWCERQRETEAAMASALLPGARRDEGRDAYQGEGGEILFRSDGTFSASFLPGVHLLEGQAPEDHARQLLTQAGFPCAILSCREEDGVTTVVAGEYAGDYPVFNHSATLLYREGSLLSLEGRRLWGETSAGQSGEGLDVPTLLVRFLSGVREGGYVCREVRSMTAGYRATAEASGRFTLVPVWRIETDSMTFYLDAATGALQTG